MEMLGCIIRYRRVQRHWARENSSSSAKNSRYSICIGRGWKPKWSAADSSYLIHWSRMLWGRSKQNVRAYKQSSLCQSRRLLWSKAMICLMCWMESQATWWRRVSIISKSKSFSHTYRQRFHMPKSQVCPSWLKSSMASLTSSSQDWRRHLWNTLKVPIKTRDSG